MPRFAPICYFRLLLGSRRLRSCFKYFFSVFFFVWNYLLATRPFFVRNRIRFVRIFSGFCAFQAGFATIALSFWGKCYEAFTTVAGAAFPIWKPIRPTNLHENLYPGKSKHIQTSMTINVKITRQQCFIYIPQVQNQGWHVVVLSWVPFFFFPCECLIAINF